MIKHVNEHQMVFIHGWGMNRGIWAEMCEKLILQAKQQEINLDILCLDLPGYANTPTLDNENTIHNIANELIKKIDPIKQIVLIGWSLGGLVATSLSQLLGERVNSLVLFASTPKFTQSVDWPYAVEQKVFDLFLSQLQNDYQKVIQRFIAITVMGSATAKADRKKISQALAEVNGDKLEDDILFEQVLEEGLELLLQTDYRQLLKQINVPLILMLGNRDTLVPIEAMQSILDEKRKDKQACELIVIQGAGHAPFISHQQECIHHLLNVIDP